MAEAELVTRDEAAWVFRRAAELEATAVQADVDLVDQPTLEAAAAEAGLSTQSVRVALGELRRGALALPAEDARPARGTLVRSRAVPGPPFEVARGLDALARRNVLATRRSRQGTTVWCRRQGLGAALLRAVTGRRRRPLASVERLTAILGDVPGAPGMVHVELRAQLRPAWQLLPLRTQVRVGAGAAVGAGVVVVAQHHAGLQLDDVLLTLAGASGATWSAGRGVRAAGEARAAIGDALAYALDQLERRLAPAPHYLGGHRPV